MREYLSGLTLDKALVFVMGHNLEEIGIMGPWKSEKWYGTRYMDTDISALRVCTTRVLPNQPLTLFAQVSHLNDIPELYLPKPNEFIPKIFDCLKVVASEVSNYDLHAHMSCLPYMFARTAFGTTRADQAHGII